MNPVIIGNAELWLGGCMDYMKTLPDKAFDLAIVDPPYGIGTFTRDSYTSLGGRGPRVKNVAKFDLNYEWNAEIPPPEYFAELRRVSIRQIIWGANYYNCFSGGALIWYKGDQTKTVSHAEIASLSWQNRVDYVLP